MSEPDVPNNQSFSVMIDELNKRLGCMEGEFCELKTGVAENTRVTEDIKVATSDLVDFFQSAQGAFRVLEALGKAARPLMYIAGFVSSVAAAWATYRSNR